MTVNANTKYSNLAANDTVTRVTLVAQWKDIQKPVITGLENGKTYCGNVEFTISDNDGIASVKAGDEVLTVGTNGKYTLEKGVGTVTVVVTDNTGNIAQVSVTVNNGHTYGEWQSNGDSTHTRCCTVTGCDGSETKNCAGGRASYFTKAVCDICHTEYGALLTDSTVPTGEITVGTNKWNRFLNTITFGLFFKDTQSVTVTAADDSYSHAGYTDDKAVKVEYYLYSGDTALTKADLAGKEFTEYNGDVNINPDNKYVFYARLNDHAGNVTYISSEGVVLDATTPVISGVENGEIYCEAQTVTVTEEYVESVKVNGTAVTLDENNRFILNPAEGTQTIVVTDKAGNVSAEIIVTVNDGHTDENKDHKCDYCGEEVTTCEDNNKDHLCDICGATLSEHTGGEATCRGKAVCEYCGEDYGEFDSTNHNLEKISAKAATVTATGNEEYWHCLDCGKYFADENGTNEIKLDDTVTQKLPPEIIEGKGQNITVGEKKALTFRSNAAFSDFIRVQLDGKTLDEKNYTVREGSTVVTLKSDYVATLSAGEHTIGIVSESGTATTTFTVNAKEVADNDAKSPQTGDNNRLNLWIALFFVSGGLLTVTAVYGKRKRYHAKHSAR